VLLHEPAWILLDDSTGALDEETERSLYQLLAERLSASAVVSIAHRPSVSRHHERSWRLVPMDGAGSRLEEVG
jgi:putative ATP-binding cassette transporter